MNQAWIEACLGGSLIGLSASIMLLLTGQVAGISGILYGGLFNFAREKWKVFFLGGLLAGGVLMVALSPHKLRGEIDSAPWTLIIAGTLVGYGTRLGSGCTSGHGVCGLSRHSLRSLVATLTFMLAGFLSVFLFKELGWIG